MLIFPLVITIVDLTAPFIILYFVENWKRLIWESRGRVFRIRTNGTYWDLDRPWWVVEKRFLCFYVNCSGILTKSHFFTKHEAIESLFKYIRMQNHEQ